MDAAKIFITRLPTFRNTIPKVIALGVLFGSFLDCRADGPTQVDLQRSEHHTWFQQELILQGMGIANPSLMLGLLGPRFFDPETWTRAQQEQIVPATLYKPVNTWAHWVRADQWVYEEAKKNFQSGFIPKIDLVWLKNLYAKAMGGAAEAVEFRDEDIVGLALVPRNRLSVEEYQNVTKLQARQNVRDPREALGEVLSVLKSNLLNKQEILFKPTSCEVQFPSGIKHFRDLSSDQLQKLVLDGQSEELRMQIAQNSICGFFLYPEVERVPELVNDWILEFNRLIGGDGGVDPYVMATELSRSLVTIHPYMDGNGRLSRLIQDYILMSRGLPPALFKDMNKDYIMTSAQWQKEMEEGSQRYLQQQRLCIDYLGHSDSVGTSTTGLNPSSLKYICFPVDMKNLVPRRTGPF